jgi:hypothetical protein
MWLFQILKPRTASPVDPESGKRIRILPSSATSPCIDLPNTEIFWKYHPLLPYYARPTVASVISALLHLHGKPRVHPYA